MIDASSTFHVNAWQTSRRIGTMIDLCGGYLNADVLTIYESSDRRGCFTTCGTINTRTGYFDLSLFFFKFLLNCLQWHIFTLLTSKVYSTYNTYYGTLIRTEFIYFTFLPKPTFVQCIFFIYTSTE